MGVGSRSDETARLRLLYELGCAFTARVDLANLCDEVLKKSREVLEAESASILLLDAEKEELYFPFVSGGVEVKERLSRLRFPAAQGIAGRVLQSRRSVRVDDVNADPAFYSGVDERSGTLTRNLLCSPLNSERGAIGVVQVLNRRGGQFSDADLDFLDALAGSIAVAIENARLYARLRSQVSALERAVSEHHQLIALRQELDIARSIQQSILPSTFPPFPDRAEFDVFASMQAAREVGGDFYDFFLIDRTRFGFLVGDVSGKGVPAALFMAVSRTLLKSIALQGVSPGVCLERVNSLLCLENSSEMFVTVFYGVLDTSSGVIEYSNGGHNPPYVVRRSGAVEALPGTGGVVLGVLPDRQYASGRVQLAPGETIFVYSDGITEAADAGENLFTEERLVESLRRRPTASPEAVAAGVIDDVQSFAGEEPQSDDITALAVAFRG
jgi:phosphoserine phosphatase RsbU/P